MSPEDVRAVARAALSESDVSILIEWRDDEVQRLEVYRFRVEAEAAWHQAVALYAAERPGDPIAHVGTPRGDRRPPAHEVCYAVSDTRTFQAVVWNGVLR